MVELLEEPQLVRAADERRLQGLAPVAPAALRDDTHRPPGGNGHGLALERLLADGVEHDRPGRGALRRFADENGPGRRRGLQPGGGVDQIAGDHPLADRPEGHGGLAGEHAGPCLDRGSEGTDRVDQGERGADGPLGVVFPGARRAPDRHHGVADELLDCAAVTLHHVPGELEVAGEQLTRLLGIHALREAGEPDQVREEDRDETSLGDRRRGGGSDRCRRRCTDERARGRRPGDPTRPRSLAGRSRSWPRRSARTRERRGALPTQLRGRRVGSAAGRADQGEPGGALGAELGTARVLRAAVRTDHRPPLTAACSRSVPEVSPAGRWPFTAPGRGRCCVADAPTRARAPTTPPAGPPPGAPP